MEEEEEEPVDVSELLNEIIISARRTLSYLKSTDFDSDGTNETGFKNIIISAIHHFFERYPKTIKWELYSEKEVIVINKDTKVPTTKFTDIVIIVKNEFGLVIELKYIQGPYLDGYYKKLPYVRLSDPSTKRFRDMLKRRSELTTLGEKIKKLHEKEIRELKFNEKFNTTETKLTVAERETYAIEQVNEYKDALIISDNTIKWYASTMVGVVSDLVIYRSDYLGDFFK